MRQSYNSGYTEAAPSLGPGKPAPFIKAILISNILIFAGQYFYPRLTELFGLTPALFFGQFPKYIYQVFTYMLLHGGFWLLFFNMFTLWMFGTEIEYTWGTRSFGKFYLLCGLAGAALTLAVFPTQYVITIGASAAIYGVMVAYWLMFPNRYLYIYFLFPVKVKWAIPAFMFLGFFFGGPHVAHMAHLGGALCGLAYIKLDWRWTRIGRKLKTLRYRRQEAKLEKKRLEAQEIMKRVDSILDKINEVGIEKLSRADRKFLEDASVQLGGSKKERENSR